MIVNTSLTDIVGLRLSGIFPSGREPSIRTLREWTKLRRIPYHRLGHFVYYDAIEATTLRELCESSEKYDNTAHPENATPVILAVEINVKTQ